MLPEKTENLTVDEFRLDEVECFRRSQISDVLQKMDISPVAGGWNWRNSAAAAQKISIVLMSKAVDLVCLHRQAAHSFCLTGAGWE